MFYTDINIIKGQVAHVKEVNVVNACHRICLQNPILCGWSTPSSMRRAV